MANEGGSAAEHAVSFILRQQLVGVIFLTGSSLVTLVIPGGRRYGRAFGCRSQASGYKLMIPSGWTILVYRCRFSSTSA
jgi:hypothetical protein